MAPRALRASAINSIITAAAASRNWIRYCILSALRYRRHERGGKLVDMSRMTSCRMCGGMIAETASACRRCGTTTLEPRTSVVAVGLIIMLVIAILYVLLIRYSWVPNPRPSAEWPPLGGFFITTKPARSKCLTSRFATRSAMNESASWTRLRPAYRSANASAAARSSGSAGVSLSSGIVDRIGAGTMRPVE